MRRWLAKIVMRLIGPELEAEIDRRAESIAQHRAGIALSLAHANDRLMADTATAQAQHVLDFCSGQLRQAVNILGAQDADAFRLLDRSFGRVLALLQARADALPGEPEPAREELAPDVVPPSKLLH